MSRGHYENGFCQTLLRLEVCLETPLVAGDLTSWATSVREAIEGVRPELMQHIEKTHVDQLAEIGETAPGLLSRVELLRKEDDAIRQQFSSLTDKAECLAAQAATVEPDEGKVRDDMAQLIELGIAFVIRARKQEVALSTWLLEAFDRDPGAVD